MNYNSLSALSGATYPSQGQDSFAINLESPTCRHGENYEDEMALALTCG